jgi:hypothetical protein
MSFNGGVGCGTRTMVNGPESGMSCPNSRNLENFKECGVCWRLTLPSLQTQIANDIARLVDIHEGHNHSLRAVYLPCWVNRN